mmetsp:Transcript_49160/g.157906  ORF Transcript_49160/g.157906 Transcript_49160/m.157906 type:complete len:200 (-) Transcript_49160:8-607(-)
MPSRNLRMSLFLTAQMFWISAHVRETASMSLPERTISSLTSSLLLTVVSLRASTTRMTFSPRKLRISTRLAPLVMETLMGKWEYTKRILYSKPLVTPVIAFSMWLTHVRIEAVALPPVNHFSTTTLRSSEPSSKKMSIGMCLKLSSREPRGPVTLTARDLIANVTPSTISNVCLFWVNFMAPARRTAAPREPRVAAEEP